MTRPLLEVRDIETAYGTSQVLFGGSFDVAEGEFVTLIGRNGMGKSTTLHTVTGLLAPARGSVVFASRPLHGRPSFQVAQAGIGLVPEGRHVFPNLTVRENLVATAARHGGGAPLWTLQRVYAMFPRLEERQRNLGANLSGGEQQMLAIGRALMTNPRLLILDEATEGLSPMVRADIWRCLAELKREGLALIVVDKNLGPLLRLADRHHVMEKGRVVWQGDSPALRNASEVVEAYLGV